MHWSILAVGSLYDLVSSKSDSAISKGSHLKVGQGGCVMCQLHSQTSSKTVTCWTVTCEFLVKKKK